MRFIAALAKQKRTKTKSTRRRVGAHDSEPGLYPVRLFNPGRLTMFGGNGPTPPQVGELRYTGGTEPVYLRETRYVTLLRNLGRFTAYAGRNAFLIAEQGEIILHIEEAPDAANPGAPVQLMPTERMTKAEIHSDGMHVNVFHDADPGQNIPAEWKEGDYIIL